jgi:hypothetical protein
VGDISSHPNVTRDSINFWPKNIFLNLSIKDKINCRNVEDEVQEGNKVTDLSLFLSSRCVNMPMGVILPICMEKAINVTIKNILPTLNKFHLITQ